jgi:hypothetical protein
MRRRMRRSWRRSWKRIGSLFGFQANDEFGFLSSEMDPLYHFKTQSKATPASQPANCSCFTSNNEREDDRPSASGSQCHDVDSSIPSQ